MTPELLQFFAPMPAALPLYQAVEGRILNELEHVNIQVKKTQITFKNRYGFAYVSLPARKLKGRPETCIIVTFGLPYRLEDARIFVATEPYPNRWTHHVIMERAEEMDDQLMGWIRDSYGFSMVK